MHPSIFRKLKMLFVFIFAFSLGCMFTAAFTKIDPTDKSTLRLLEFDILVLIISAPKNLIQRNTIRETWLQLKNVEYNNFNLSLMYMDVPTYDNEGFLRKDSISLQKDRLELFKKIYDSSKIIKSQREHINRKFKIKHLFAVGIMNLTRQLVDSLKSEHNDEADMLLLPEVVDMYKTLSYKLVDSFKALNQKYKFKYLLKSDDDSYVKLNMLAQDLHAFDLNLQEASLNLNKNPRPELYWGFFNGAAHVKISGPWAESHWRLSDRYLPYAVGGAYVVTHGIVEYVARNADILSKYSNEDVSLGAWLAPLRNVIFRHDPRFDTEWSPRGQSSLHVVLHKLEPQDMEKIWVETKGGQQTVKNQFNVKRYGRGGYHYNWDLLPSKCCERNAIVP